MNEYETMIVQNFLVASVTIIALVISGSLWSLLVLGFMVKVTNESGE